MSMIRVENLTFSYPSSYDTIFEGVSFQIDTDWKLGLIGRNGRGKTTLLRLLQGQEEYQGRIQAAVQFDYFPYPVREPHRQTGQILQEVCPQAQEWELRRELSCLEVRKDALERPFSTLSNGEQTKVLLAALFLNEGHFLLIDEPTNHLDTEARAVVAAYLRRKKGFILVSHDRSFLDVCVDHILSINRADIEVQSGNFSSWYENFCRQQEFELAQDARLRKSIAEMEQAARQTKRWSDAVEKSKNGARTGGAKADKGYIGHKAAKMMQRAKNLENRQQRAIEEKSALLRNREWAEELKIHPLPYFSETLLTLSGVAPAYGGTAVCAPVTLAVQQGERILLDGRNGSGKSSLLRLLTGQPVEHCGTLSLGSGLVISYVPQDPSGLQGTLEDFVAESGIEETLFKAILRKMDFSRLQFEKRMEDFSAGQKKKVLRARSLCQRAHLYLWDEPLNYIDLYTRLQIEELIRAFSPTMVLVEHDRAFQQGVATRTVRLAALPQH